jgi:hypothetical protein
LKTERRIIEFILAAAAVLIGLGIYLKPVDSSTAGQLSKGIACTTQKASRSKEASGKNECNKTVTHS